MKVLCMLVELCFTCHQHVCIEMKNSINLYSIVVLSFLVACNLNEEVPINKDMSLCAFIISDNDLDDHTDYIEKDLVKGLKGCPIGTELFLYVDRKDRKPTLRKLFLLESGKVGVKTITEYEEQFSTSPDVFKEVLNSMIKESSGRRYGLIYWSHGNGWLPGLSYNQGTQKNTRAIGLDGIYSMNVEDFGLVLKDVKTPCFVVLDACYMGAVEVAYTLRNSTDFLISSSSETLGVTFPYHLILPDLVEGTNASLSHSLDLYLDYCYSDYYGDGTISGMASLIDCNQMDALAATFKQVLLSGSINVDTDSIQSFDYSFPHCYYDLRDYANAVTRDSIVMKLFDTCLDQAVIKKVTTPSLYSVYGGEENLMAVKNFSGLSVYIPGVSKEKDSVYKLTEWYKDCYE